MNLSFVFGTLHRNGIIAAASYGFKYISSSSSSSSTICSATSLLKMNALRADGSRRDDEDSDAGSEPRYFLKESTVPYSLEGSNGGPQSPGPSSRWSFGIGPVAAAALPLLRRTAVGAQRRCLPSTAAADDATTNSEILRAPAKRSWLLGRTSLRDNLLRRVVGLEFRTWT